jgi:hypothetical protein
MVCMQRGDHVIEKGGDMGGSGEGGHDEVFQRLCPCC